MITWVASNPSPGCNRFPTRICVHHKVTGDPGPQAFICHYYWEGGQPKLWPVTKHLHLLSWGLLLGFKENINHLRDHPKTSKGLRYWGSTELLKNLPRTCGGWRILETITSRFPLIAWSVFLFPFRWEGNLIFQRLPSWEMRASYTLFTIPWFTSKKTYWEVHANRVGRPHGAKLAPSTVIGKMRLLQKHLLPLEEGMQVERVVMFR